MNESMSKLIKLLDGPYIKADSILEIGEPWQNFEQWFYTIAFKDKNGVDIRFRSVELSATFVKTEEKANQKIDSFVERINNLL